MLSFIKFILPFIIIVSANISIEAKTKIWNNPVAETNYNNHDGYFYPIINVTKVEATPHETILHMAVSYRSENSFIIPSKSCITVGNDTLTVINANNIELDSATFCKKDIERRFTLKFPPLPAGTTKFDFHGGYPIDILGISDVSSIENRIIPSNWRNESTGDWEIGFYNEGVIYDCRFWKYAGGKRFDNFEITDGEHNLVVKVGKLKNGKRNIKICDRSITCSMITGRTLPPYPVKDESTSFKNNRYNSGDTAVIVGWLKDLPKGLRKRNEYYKASYTDIFTDEEIEANSKLDSIGRFVIKIPVINSTECFMDWNKTYIRTCIEPGETYFLFYDFKRGQKLFMGKNCRLQNELLAHPLKWTCLSMGYNFKSDNYDEYLKAIDASQKQLAESLDSLCMAVPTLSQRFYIYVKEHQKCIQAGEMGQSRFNFKTKSLCQLPENMTAYMRDNFWQTTTSPYSLHRETKRLIYDYVHDYTLKHPANTSVSSDYIINNMDKLGFSDEDRVLLEKWKKAQSEYEKALANVTDTTERKLMSQRYMSENAQLLDDVQNTLNSEKNSNIIMSELALMNMIKEYALLDSLNANAETKNIWLAQKGFDLIDNMRKPLTPGMIRFLKENITIESALKRIMQENQIYVDLGKRTGSNTDQKTLVTVNISDSDDGETILQKIIAPHKGKIILLDIWGTWCAPCRLALSKSQEEYAQLKDYDIVYIYLANNSPEESWRNVIEQYNVKGDNCFHYNLPSNQQAAVEAFLKVNAYPTYKLFDQNGNLLKVNANPNDLDLLKSLMDRLVK